MTALQEFLNALYPPTEGLIRLEIDENVPLAIEGPDDLNALLADANGDTVYAYPSLTTGETCYVYEAFENASEDQWLDLVTPPTVVVFHPDKGVMICAWALSTLPDDQDQEIVGLMHAMGGDVSMPIPTPGTGGWVSLHNDPEAIVTIEQLIEAYEPAIPVAAYTPVEQVASEDAPPWDDATQAPQIGDYGTLEDAHILTPIAFDDPIYSQEMVISNGANFKSVKWIPKKMPVGLFLSLLAKHPENAKKDGLGFVLAEIIGDNRRKQAVKACYGIGLDIDVGLSGKVIDEALAKLGCTAIRYTTHSHGKTTSKLNKDKIVKWCQKHDLDFGNDAILRFLREESKWDSSLLETAEYAGDEHEASGLMALISHAPMQKHRIVMPLAEAFVPTAVAPTHAEGMKMWADICKALARVLGDLPMDNSATDPSRLFYYPRHAKGRPHETTMFGGPLFDWKSLDLTGIGEHDLSTEEGQLAALAEESEKPQKGKSKSTTKEGVALGRWSIKRAGGFQIADVLRDLADDRIRTHGSTKLDIECPFDEDHSNPGDPEDRGCFVCNAGDGPSEIFTIRCAHDACQSRTNLDFLGKMIKDDWFSNDVLEDEQYNALADDDAPASPAAEKIIKEDSARAEYEVLIDALHEDSLDDEVEDAIRAVVNAALGERALLRAETDIRSKLKMTQATFSRLFKTMRKKVARENNKTGDQRDPKGRMVFSFDGEFNFDEAFDACFRVLSDVNRKAGEPIFSYNQDKPVRLNRNPTDNRVTFEALTTSRPLWSELNKLLTFIRKNEVGEGVRQMVDSKVADHVYEQSYKELPMTPEIVYTPLFTASGSLVVDPGYYPNLNLLMPDTGFKVDVPDQPSWADVEEAVDFLRNDLLIDFPFLDYDNNDVERREPSEANCLSMILTPFMRRMINGCTPVFFVAKPTPGTGGTLLGKVPMLIFDGAESAPMRYTQNEEEMQKALLAAIMESRSHLFFDDVKDFNNRSLLQSITSKKIGGRQLGATRNIERPNIFNWVATGNNPNVLSEMERRIVWIRINARTPDIQTRIYKHDLPLWIPANRSKLVSAILTMIQYWIDLGQPLFEDRKRASFEEWSMKVGGVLQACGIEGFLDNRPSAGGDLDESAIKSFVKLWFGKFGFEKVSTAKLFEYAVTMECDIVEGNNDDQKKQRFPKRMHTLDGRVFAIDGVEYIIKTTYDEDQNMVWRMELNHAPAEAIAA